MAKKNSGGKQASTKGSKASFNQQSVNPSRSSAGFAPTSSPVPNMRPDNFAQIAASQGVGGNGGGGGIANIARAMTGGGGNVAPQVQAPAQQGFLSNFNPLDFGLIGLARSLFGNMGGGNGGSRGPSANNVPQPRPTIRQSGDQLIATRDVPRFGFSAGDTAPVPEYRSLSFRGLTSTDPGNVMRNIMGSERNNAAYNAMFPNQDNDGSETQPTSPVTTAPTNPNQMPGERPSWWPAYLPWPPAPNVSVPQATPAVPPMGSPLTGSLPVPTRYGTSYSNLQGAISGAQNPLMMGIGGMLRRP